MGFLAYGLCIGRIGTRTDICIYGATPGGIAAALAASQHAKNVILVTSGDHLGGLFTSGLSHSDFHSFESLSGTFLNVTQQVKAYYQASYGEDAPQVAASFEGTFAEPKVNLLVNMKGNFTIPCRLIIFHTACYFLTMSAICWCLWPYHPLLASTLGIAEQSLEEAQNRLDFIRTAYAYFLEER